MDIIHDNIPSAWKKVELRDLVFDEKADIVDGPFGSNLKKMHYQVCGVPLIRIQNVDRDKFINENIRYITPEKATELKRHSYSNGDIIITKLGKPLGKACIVPEYVENGIIIADIVRVRIGHPYVDKKYLIHAINSPRIIFQLSQKVKGTTRPRVNLGHIRGLSLPARARPPSLIL